MADSSPLLKIETGRAPSVAQGTLCLLALACVIAAVVGLPFGSWGAGSRSTDAELAQAEAALLNSVSPRPPTPGMLPPGPPPVLPSAASLPDAASAKARMLVPAPSPFPGIPAIPTGPLSTSPPRPTLPPGKELKNPEAMQAVLAARVMRQQENMQAAIESLKKANDNEPNHPEILGEMAAVYEDMGIMSRAEAIWRQIYAMGEANAGGYFAIAATKIGNRGDSASTPPAPEASALPVTLGPCRLTREPIPNRGERVIVHLPIQASPGTTVDSSKLEIRVTFYESVNKGERIEQVSKDRPGQTQTFSTMPLDWREPGGEIVDAACTILTKSEGSADTREFHGYSVKLFYQDKLAGEQAQPESLRTGAPQGGARSGLDNALFPK